MTNGYAEQDPAYKDLLIWFKYASLKSGTGVYILENTPPSGEGKNQPMSFGGKNMKRRREKGGNKRKRKKG